VLKAAGIDNRDALGVGRVRGSPLKLTLPSNDQPPPRFFYASYASFPLAGDVQDGSYGSDGSIEKTTAVPNLHGGDHSTQFPVTRVQQVWNSMSLLSPMRATAMHRAIP
jgi:hypothetical protein